ncbi:MAG: dephospho-CoA kinase [Coriobacteriia bacterium]|nr:dephospho-CoA kinase [Coriobacteriia bacterium]
MKIIVVIGGIGSGKSTVSGAFRDLGAAFIDLDKVGHEILLRDDVKADLVAAFGSEIIGDDGEIVRPELAKRAFVSPESTEQLNNATQPRIIEEAKSRMAAFEEDGALATVIEISPYDGPQGRFGVFTDMADATVAVVAPIEVRVKRAAGKFSEEDICNRIARQASDEQRRSWATHVVVNDGTVAALRWEVEEIWDSVVLS